jgi:hypothetical protein
MNARIKELWQQSKNPSWDGELGAANELNPEKFAQLLIKECVDKIQGLKVVERDETDTNFHYWNSALGHAVLEIEQQFSNDKDEQC